MAFLLQSSARVGLRSAVSASSLHSVGIAGVAGVRYVSKVTLPDLKYDFGALEPAISGQIMETHYTKHHQTYVNNYNASIEKLAEAQEKGDIQTQIALQSAINFNGGGHINHTLFWENLAPQSAGGGAPPEGALSAAIVAKYGSYDKFTEQFNAALAGIQGSGWAWLVKDKATGEIGIKTYAVSAYNTRTAKQNTSRPSGRSSTGRQPKSAFSETARTGLKRSMKMLD
ncbi:hypothetical protein KEM54_005108 [Ascosphaera aggregata]|nr:hypothetical protein KEM54_005108 [Ascosphaera aggregata]